MSLSLEEQLEAVEILQKMEEDDRLLNVMRDIKVPPKIRLSIVRYFSKKGGYEDVVSYTLQALLQKAE